MSDLCSKKNDEYTVCSALVLSRGLCRIFALRTRHTQCLGACSFACLMSDLCLKNEEYTVCRGLVPSSGSCRILNFALVN